MKLPRTVLSEEIRLAYKGLHKFRENDDYNHCSHILLDCRKSHDASFFFFFFFLLFYAKIHRGLSNNRLIEIHVKILCLIF